MGINDMTTDDTNRYQYRVGILDDEPVFAQSMENETRRILTRAGIPHQISVYTDSASLLAHIVDLDKVFDCLLLDILMDGLNGMRLARHLRDMGCDAAIIFITSTEDFALEGYQVDAFRYLLKPVNPLQLEELLLLDYRRQHRIRDIFLPFGAGEYRRLPLSELLFAETILRKTVLHLLSPETGQTITQQIPERITQLQNLLPPTQFIRCHRGVLVNLEHAQSLRRYELTLKTGSKVPVSRQSYDAVKKAYFRYLTE